MCVYIDTVVDFVVLKCVYMYLDNQTFTVRLCQNYIIVGWGDSVSIILSDTYFTFDNTTKNLHDFVSRQKI